MAKKRAKHKSPFISVWHIVSMTAWDEDFFNEEVQAFVEFKGNGTGDFHFGNLQGQVDCREAIRDGQPAVEWTWDGNAEMDPAQGRGWAVLKGDDLHGMIFFHMGTTPSSSPAGPKEHRQRAERTWQGRGGS